MRILALGAAVALFGVTGCASARSSPGAAASDQVVAGAAAIDITPGQPIRLTGYGNRVLPARVVGQRLWAKALAFGTDAERPSVLITADLIGIPRHVTDAVASRLQNAGIARARVAIAATHTHTGPSIARMLPHIFSTPLTSEQQVVVEEYTGQLTNELEQVARAALADRRPSQIKWGRGTVRFAAHRRVVKAGKWVAFGVDPKGSVDHDLPVLAVRGPDGALRAVLASYACHATTLDASDNFIHGDWPGAAQAIIQQRHPGSIAMIAIGTGADANPNPRGRGLSDVEHHAREIAGEIDRLLASKLSAVSSPPEGQIRDVAVAFSRVPTREEWQAQASRSDPSGAYARAVIPRLERGETIAATTPYPVQTWTFGRDLAMVFLAGEVVSEYGLRLKRELNGERLWVNAYSNDVPFYVASRRMIPEGGYEVDRSMVYYGQPSPLAEGTEDLIVAAVREMLPSRFGRR